MIVPKARETSILNPTVLGLSFLILFQLKLWKISKKNLTTKSQRAQRENPSDFSGKLQIKDSLVSRGF